MTLLTMDESSPVSCSGEVKTDYLTLCSGISGAFHEDKKLDSVMKRVRNPVSTSRVAQLRGYDHDLLSRKPGGERMSPDFLRSEHSCNRKNPLGSFSLPRLVKVTVYTKAASPYLVIYDSNKKYAKPAAYVKLVNCVIKRCGESIPNVPSVRADDNDRCAFWIVPAKHLDDADGAHAITLRAPNLHKCDEWVELLSELTKGGLSNNQFLAEYVPGSSVLPTLDEQDDAEGENDIVPSNTESLKAPLKRRTREGRRNSLNSLGIRLRSYSNSKQR